MSRRARIEIRPETWARRVVWAKLGKWPWWPAIVLSETDQCIPSNSEPPRHGAVPVRFFGTYDFSWIESQRSLSPFDTDFDERASASHDPEFIKSVQEAQEYENGRELPDGFNSPIEDPEDFKQTARKKGGGRTKAAGAMAVGATSSMSGVASDGVPAATIVYDRPAPEAAASAITFPVDFEDLWVADEAGDNSIARRRMRVLRKLGYAAPVASPFAATRATNPLLTPSMQRI